MSKMVKIKLTGHSDIDSLLRSSRQLRDQGTKLKKDIEEAVRYNPDAYTHFKKRRSNQYTHL